MKGALRVMDGSERGRNKLVRIGSALAETHEDGRTDQPSLLSSTDTACNHLWQ